MSFGNECAMKREEGKEDKHTKGTLPHIPSLGLQILSDLSLSFFRSFPLTTCSIPPCYSPLGTTSKLSVSFLVRLFLFL